MPRRLRVASTSIRRRGGGGVSIPELYVDATSLWKMDESSGDALDTIGGQDGDDVNLVGAAAGLVDGARLMVKTSVQYFSIPDSTDLKGGNKDFTIACMYRPTTSTSDTGLFGRWDYSPVQNREYIIYWNSGTITFLVNSDGELSQKTVNSAVAGSAGNWYKIIAWHDSVNQLIGISVNDETPVTAAWALGVHSSVQTTEIGAYNAGSTANGRFDQVAHWNRVLSAADITSYNNLTAYP